MCFVASKEPLRSLTPGLPEQSILMLGVKVIVEGLASGELVDRTALGPIGIAYAVWATVHGMAMLRVTYLASFALDFDSTNRATLTAVLSAWSREP